MRNPSPRAGNRPAFRARPRAALFAMCSQVSTFAAFGVLAALAQLASPAVAETRVFTGPGLAERTPQPGALNAQLISDQVGFDQRLGEPLPLDLPFRDETGKDVRLGDYFGAKPVLLAFVYYRCPVLCPQIIIGTAAAMKGVSYEPGREFEVVFVSFDPEDTPEQAAEKKSAAVERYGKPESAAGWHFLTGEADAIRAPDRGGGLPLRLGSDHPAVRARQRGRRGDPRWPVGALPLRRRIRAEGPQTRALRGW